MSASEECKLGDSEHGYAHKVRPETVRDLDYMTSVPCPPTMLGGNESQSARSRPKVSRETMSGSTLRCSQD